MVVKHQAVYRVNPDCDISRLHNICRVNNERIESGEESTLTWGHTSSEDPELITIRVGYADNFVVEGDILYADFHYEQSWSKEQLQTHNKVSAEVWYDDAITPIALLARNRPQLELGVVHYQMPERGEISHKSYEYEKENEENKETPYINKEVENMSPQEISQLFTETLEHSEFYAKFCDLMENIVPKLQETVKHMEDTLSPLLMEEAEEEVHEDIKPELEEEAKEIEPEKNEFSEKPAEKVEEKVEEKIEDIKPEMKKEVEKNDMDTNMASSSANNGYIADLDTEKKKVKKYQMDLIKVEQEKSELIRKYQTEVRKNELYDLSKTYVFDPKDEIEMVSSMDEDQWDMHKKIIITRYQKSPVGRTFNVVSTVPNESKDKGSIEIKSDGDRDVVHSSKVKKAMKYAQEKGVSFKEALEKV